MNVSGMGFENRLGQPGIVPNSRIGLHIDVLGPGYLKARETVFGSYEIRGGKIRALTSYCRPKPVVSILKSIQEKVETGTQRRLGGLAEKYLWFTIDWRALLQIITKLIRAATESNHGGTFIFLPDDSTLPESYGLRVPYTTEGLDLGSDLIDHCVQCIHSWEHAGTSQHESALWHAEWRRVKLLTNTDTAGHFSSIDGCVVLSRGLKVFGFGAKIDTSDGIRHHARLQFKHIASGTVYDDETFMKAIGGTRHQSAARLCQYYHDAIVFTVSQDGDIKLFCSDGEFAYVYGPLDIPTVSSDVDVF